MELTFVCNDRCTCNPIAIARVVFFINLSCVRLTMQFCPIPDPTLALTVTRLTCY